MTSRGRRRGRRTAGQETKAALLAAAREVFAEKGFEAATVRSIAARCAVDPGMVNHWFGGKEGLFLAAVEFSSVTAGVSAPPADDLGPEALSERVVSAFVTTCDGAGRGEFTALVRSIGSHELAAQILGEFVHSIVRPAVAALSLDLLEERVAMCCAHMIGLGMARYVLGMEPLASAHPRAVAALIAPSLEHYLSDGEICDHLDSPLIPEGASLSFVE